MKIVANIGTRVRRNLRFNSYQVDATYAQHWVLCKLGLTSKHQQIANPGFSSSRRISIRFCNHLHQHIFNQQRLWADGILFPHLHKAVHVVRQHNACGVVLSAFFASQKTTASKTLCCLTLRLTKFRYALAFLRRLTVV